MKVRLHSTLKHIYSLAAFGILYSLINLTHAKAQSQFQQFLSPDKGLSSTLMGEIIQDHNGYLWIATENGLNKYNGTTLKCYLHDANDPNSLCSNYVRSLFEDNNGNLFIGTYNGIQIYNPSTDAFSLAATFEDGKPFNNLINHIIQRANGDILISGNILSKITIDDKGQPIVKLLDIPIPTTSTEEVFEDSHQRLWITKEGHGIYRLDPDNTVHHYHTETGNDPFCLCIREDMKGNILAGTSKNGLYRYNPNIDHFVKIGSDKYITRALLVYSDEETLICTDGQGLKSFNNSTGTITDFYIGQDGIESDKLKVHSVTKDKQGNLWLSVYQHGALMVPAFRRAFNYIGSHARSRDIIGTSCITALKTGSNNEIYVGTDNDGIYIVSADKKTSKHITSDYITNIPLIAIGLLEDSEHCLWIGSYGSGASRLNLKTMKCESIAGILDKSGEPVSNVYDFIEDKEKRVWIATMGGGLQCYDLKNGNITNCTEINDLVNNWITCIDYSPRTNSLILGTYDGLWRIGLNDFGKDNIQAFGGCIIHDIHEDADGIIWAATSDGLARWGGNSKGLENQATLLFSQSNGLPSNICYSIEEDSFDRLWISTGNGLVRMHRETFGPTSYFIEDGIQGNEFSKNASTKNPLTGELFFGGVNGITWFKPQDVLTSSHKWEVYISGFYIAGKPVKEDSKSGGRRIIDGPISQAKDIYLSNIDNAFTIEIGTNDLSNTLKKSIMYSMNNEGWISLPKGIHQVSFASLPSGTYNFKAKVIDGTTESDICTTIIHIRAPWWQSWWVISLLIAIILSLVYYFADQLRNRRILRHKMFKHIQSERNSESKLQFLTNVSHEIRTPMTLIINPLQQLISSDSDENRQRSYKLMFRNANRIMSLVNQLMDVRKIEHGQLKMKMKETELVAYLSSLTNSFEDIATSNNISLNFHKIGIEQLSAWIDEENFDKVIMNLLSNALKYTPTGGSIDIYLTATEAKDNNGKAVKSAEIIVADNGQGIPDSELSKVFERFFQARNHKSGNGTGVGLHLSRSIVNLHHGTIKVENNPDKAPGCRFIVTIPLGNSHLKKEEFAEVTTSNKEKANYTKDDFSYLSANEYDKSSFEHENDDITSSQILVVEDDNEIRKYVKEQLSDKYKVTTCENGVEALEAIRAKIPSLLISDVMMPEMDGFTLCKKIRQNIQYNDLPIILLTAKTMNDDNIKGLEIGADAYITKPFDVRVLKQTISSLLRSRQTLRNIYSGNQAQTGKLEEIQTKSPDEKLVEKVMKVISDNIGNPDLSVELIADKVGISRVHLHRKLRQLTNQTTRDLIRNQRITLAAKILKEKKMPIAEVAYYVGFSSPAHFTTSFKQMYGISPTQFMKEADPAEI